jgi:hypothetical protein
MKQAGTTHFLVSASVRRLFKFGGAVAYAKERLATR